MSTPPPHPSSPPPPMPAFAVVAHCARGCLLEPACACMFMCIPSCLLGLSLSFALVPSACLLCVPACLRASCARLRCLLRASAFLLPPCVAARASFPLGGRLKNYPPLETKQSGNGHARIAGRPTGRQTTGNAYAHANAGSTLKGGTC